MLVADMPGITWSPTALDHASSCTESKCGTAECPQARRLFYHHKNCKEKAECQLCCRLRELAGPHAASCALQRCKFPFCKNIRHNNQRDAGKEELQDECKA